jgi:ADP-ribosyl-[dinitrogen reductase] hydrolase
MTTIDEKDRFRGCLLGLACGDAVGVAVEGQSRASFPTVTTMTGSETLQLKPGEWTDDTSMALCLATSLLDSEGFDPRDQMDKYVAWMTAGYLSSTGECFDIGVTCARAIESYIQTGEPLSGPEDPTTAGNGCIMRLAPVPMYYYPDVEKAIEYSAESSRTTHGARECIDACRLFAAMIVAALDGAGRDEILFGHYYRDKPQGTFTGKIELIAHGVYRHKKESEIKGSGYVVESLEAALWCFLHSDSYEDAILKAVNLGLDTDTTAAVCGQLAGAHYGESGIPRQWLDTIVAGEEIGQFADMLRLIDSSDGDGGHRTTGDDA